MPRRRTSYTLSCMACPWTHRTLMEHESRQAAALHEHTDGHACALEETALTGLGDLAPRLPRLVEEPS